MTAADRQAGWIWFRVLALAASVAVLSALLLAVLERVRHARECADNLRSVYRALEVYEIERGTLPSLAYFPDHPMEDSDSLRVVLEPYGLAPEKCVCPASHPVQRAEGLTYLWNVRLNGKRIPRGAQATWMLVDMNALSSDVPAPHWGGYHVLYSDGTVRRIRNPQRELPGL